MKIFIDFIRLCAWFGLSVFAALKPLRLALVFALWVGTSHTFVTAEENANSFHLDAATLKEKAAQAPDNLLSFPKANLSLETTSETLNFQVEVAMDPLRQAQGMMWRTELDDDKGMLFVFPDEAMRSFWMQNTLIPLDMVFIDKQGIVVHVHANAKPLDTSQVPSVFPAQAVLELRGGLAEELGIFAGDSLKSFQAIPPAE